VWPRACDGTCAGGWNLHLAVEDHPALVMFGPATPEEDRVSRGGQERGGSTLAARTPGSRKS